MSGQPRPKGDPVTRAFAAWFRAGNRDAPDTAASGLVEFDRRRYVVLRSADGALLAVYRLHLDGVLQRMRRWPPGLEEQR